MAIAASGLAGSRKFVGIGEEVVDESVKGRFILDTEAAAAIDEVDSLLKAFMVGAKEYGAGIYSRLESVVYAHAEATADVCERGVAVDGGEYANGVDDEHAGRGEVGIREVSETDVWHREPCA